VQRRDQVSERLPHPGPGLEQLHAAVVVAVGDVGRHVALAPPVLVLTELGGHRPAFAERVHHGERVDPDHRAVARHFDHDVELGGRVVDDPEPHPAVVQAGGHVEVRPGRIQAAARVVVQQHLAALGHARQGQDHVHRAARHRAGGGDDPVPVHLGDERHLAPAGLGDFAGQVGADAGRDAFGEMSGHGVPGL
jgi:hypothetical protein